MGGTRLRSSRTEFLNSFRWAARGRGDVQHIPSDFTMPSGDETWLEDPLQMEVSNDGFLIFPLLSEVNFAIHTSGAPNELLTALGAAAHELPLPPPWREAGQSFKRLSCANVM